MGRNPERYPDPQKFDPDRWIPFTQPSPYEFPVFQASDHPKKDPFFGETGRRGDGEGERDGDRI